MLSWEIEVLSIEIANKMLSIGFCKILDLASEIVVAFIFNVTKECALLRQ